MLDAKLSTVETLRSCEEDYLHNDDITKRKIKMRVDLTISLLIINETIQQQLGLDIVETKTFKMEDESLAQFPVSSPVELHFGNRRTACRALILPGNSEPVLGRIPFSDMNVVINGERGETMANPAHPDMAWMRL